MGHIGQLWTSFRNEVSQGSKSEFTGCSSETESDSDSAEGLKVKTKYQPALLFIQVKIVVYGRLQSQLIMKSHGKI